MSKIILLLKSHVDGYTRSDGTFVKPHERETFYHGTHSGNKFKKFDSKRARTGVGGNAHDQGDVTYLTSSKTAAKYFSVKANQNKDLREADIHTMGNIEDRVGTIAHVQLASDAKVKRLDHRPKQDEIKRLAAQGYDAVRFKDTAFDRLQENPLNLVAQHAKEGGSETLAVINPHKVHVIKHEHPKR